MIKIEDKWYKEIDKQDYPAYLALCKQQGIVLKIKIYQGKIVYPIIEIPKLDEIKKDIDSKIKSTSFLTLSGEKKQLNEPLKTFKYSGYLSNSNRYQYCDICKEETNFASIPSGTCCKICRNGYYL